MYCSSVQSRPNVSYRYFSSRALASSCVLCCRAESDRGVGQPLSAITWNLDGAGCCGGGGGWVGCALVLSHRILAAIALLNDLCVALLVVPRALPLRRAGETSEQKQCTRIRSIAVRIVSIRTNSATI